MQTIIKDNLDSIKALCLEHKVKSLFAFGSVVSDHFTESSDIDLLISFQAMEPVDYADHYFDIPNKFEEIFKRPVDLVTDKSLKNPYFIKSVNKNKMLLYGR